MPGSAPHCHGVLHGHSPGQEKQLLSAHVGYTPHTPPVPPRVRGFVAGVEVAWLSWVPPSSRTSFMGCNPWDGAALQVRKVPHMCHAPRLPLDIPNNFVLG